MTQAEQPIVQLGPLTPEGAKARSPLDDQVEEGSILAQARADPARFAPLYERYFARVYHYCLRRVHRPEDAEDLAGLVFIRALAGLREYRGGSFAAWLFRIAHNAAANFLRDQRPHASLEGLAAPLGTEMPDPDEPVLALVLREEERQRIAQLLAQLPDDQRDLVALKMAGELTASEIGVVLGKSEGAVRVALHRVMQRLRAAYIQSDTEGQP
jgi:RNA polymerase sigma-70 factor (ECF subfamily)